MKRIDRQIMSLKQRLEHLEFVKKQATKRAKTREQALAKRIASRKARVIAMRRTGMSIRAIASNMAVSPATVFNDLK